MAALAGVSILAERIDSDAQGKPKRNWEGGDSCTAAAIGNLNELVMTAVMSG